MAIDKDKTQGDPRGTRRRGRRLVSILDCRRALAAWIRQVEGGEMEPTLGTKLTFMVNALAAMIRDSDLERRLEALEQALEGPR